MSNLMSYIPLVELGLVVSIITSYFIANRRVNLLNAKRFKVFIFLLIVLISPINLINYEGLPFKLPLIAYVRAATGDLSITTMLLCAITLTGVRKSSINQSTIFLIALFAIIFYPLSLGLGMFDPYSFGYGSKALILGIAILGLLLLLKNYYLEVLIISIAVIAWTQQWHESANLWDYLIDPFIAAWAMIKSVQILIKNKSSII